MFIRKTHFIHCVLLMHFLWAITTMPVMAGTMNSLCQSSSLSIPNNTPSGVSDTLTISENGNILDLNVMLNASHGQVSELQFTLTHVDTGKSIVIFNQPGMSSPPGCLGQNLVNLTLDDQGTKQIDTDCTANNPAYDNSFNYVPSNALNAFNGENVNGTWKLAVVDNHNYDTNDGMLSGWCLQYERESAATFTLSPPNHTTLDFGSDIALGSSSYQTFDIQESSNLDDLWIYSAAITGIHASDFKLTDPSAGAFPFKILKNTLYTFKVACTPSGVGLRTADITLTTNLLTPFDSISYPLQCTGVAASYSASLAGSTPFAFVGTVVNVATPDQLLTISEVGGLADLNVTPSITGAHASDFSITPGATTIGKGTAQDFTVGCTPKAGGNRAATLNIATTDPAHPLVSYPLTCTASAPVYSSMPAPWSTIQFGASQLGMPISQTIKVTNSGNQDLNLLAPTFSGTGASAFSFSISFPVVIPPGGSADVVVVCTPPTTDPFLATLQIPTDDPSKSIVNYPVKCSGNTTPQPLYDSTPVLPGATFDIGSTNKGVAISKTIKVTEIGNADLTVALATPAITGTHASDFALSGLPFTIAEASGVTKNITVTCTPSEYGTRTATLHLTTNVTEATNYPAPTYTLTCNGLTPGYGSSPSPNSPIDFGSKPVGQTTTKALIVQETGATTLTVDLATPAITGSHASDFQVSGFPFSINDGGASKTITLSCKPSGLGVRTAQLNLVSNDPLHLTLTYTLACTGTEAVGPGFSSEPVIPGGTIDFGVVPPGVPATQTLFIKEVGTTVLEVNKTTNATLTGPHADDFTVSPNGYFYISNGGAGIPITLTCKHTSALEVHTATLTLTSTDTLNPMPTYSLKCTGTSLPKFNLTVTLAGDGQGSVTSVPLGIGCGNQCVYSYEQGTSVTLTPTAASNATFERWNSECASGTVMMVGDTTCTATFKALPVVAPDTQPVTVSTPTVSQPNTNPTASSSPVSNSNDPVKPETSAEKQPSAVTPTETKSSAVIPVDAVNTAIKPDITVQAPSPAADVPSAASTPSAKENTDTTGKPDTPVVSSTSNPPVTTGTPIAEGNGVQAEKSDNSVKTPPSVVTTPAPKPINPLEAEALCPVGNILDIPCDAHWETITHLNITQNGHLSHAFITGTITNAGWVADLTLKPGSALQGGIVTGYITNQGNMSDFEFRGASLTGGTLSGSITNNSPIDGFIKDVQLTAGSRITGGRLVGEIRGDSKDPARLENVTVQAGSHLENVVLAETVVLQRGVILGKGVRYANRKQCPPITLLVAEFNLDEVGAYHLTGDNPNGVSILNASWWGGDWTAKKPIKEIILMGNNHRSVGIPVNNALLGGFSSDDLLLPTENQAPTLINVQFCAPDNALSDADELVLFTASTQGKETTLAWKMTTEVNVEVYFIWRAILKEGAYTEVTQVGRIESTGDANYQFTDSGSKQGIPYCYALESVDREGHSTLYLDQGQIACTK